MSTTSLRNGAGRVIAAGVIVSLVLSLFTGTYGVRAAGEVATNPATNITSSDATMNAMNGVMDASDSSFWVSTSTIDTSTSDIPAGVYSTPVLGPVASTTSFSAPLSTVTTSGITTGGAQENMAPITPSTTYYYVAWVNIDGTWYHGSETSFTTAAAENQGGGSNTLPQPTNTVIVRPSNLASTGWTAYHFDHLDGGGNPVNPSGTASSSFVSDPTAFGDEGALELATPAAADQVLYDREDAPTPVGGIDISYQSKRVSGSPTAAPAYILGIDTDDDASADIYAYYEPAYNGGSNYDQWNTWTLDQDANFWSFEVVSPGKGGENGASLFTLQDVEDAYPDATVVEYTIGLGSGASGFDVMVDRVLTSSTIYDFEPNEIPACTAGDSVFDSFSLGSIDGQQGWKATGPYDQAIVTNTYGFSTLGCKLLRVSDVVTSGSFGDWIFAAPLANAVGESTATNGTVNPGTRQTHFEMQFDIAAASEAAHIGSHLSVSPDRGDGSRMSYLRFEDTASGIDVFFDDVISSSTAGTDEFRETQVADNLSRTAPHNIKLTLDVVEGPSNDVVTVSIDGAVVHTGTSWEDYYRFDPEASAEQTPRVVNTMIIQARGANHPADQGYGFVFDNVALTSSTPASSTDTSGNRNGSRGGSRSPRTDTTTAPAANEPTQGSTGGEVLGASTYQFTVNLHVGSLGTDVTELQKLLIAAGYLHIDAPTGYFGLLTRAAVAAFQSDHGITPAVGFFGPITRALVNAYGLHPVTAPGATGTTTTTTTSSTTTSH